jgi:hypothetical protein
MSSERAQKRTGLIRQPVSAPLPASAWPDRRTWFRRSATVPRFTRPDRSNKSPKLKSSRATLGTTQKFKGRTMRERRLWPITLTVSECARALHIERRAIYDGIRLDGLPLYRKGVRKFLLTADVVEWIRRTFKREYVK